MGDTTHISETVSAGQLRTFIERIERIEEEIKTANSDKSEIYKEARGCGFDVKAIRQCVAARKLDSAEREERTAIFELYWSALTGSVHVHAPAREIIEKFPPHDTETGEITDTQEQSGTAGEIHERPSTNDKAYLEAVPQDEASLAGTGSRMLAGREGRHEGEAASARLPTHSHSAEVPPAAEKPETAVTPLPAVSGAISDDDVPAFLKKDREPVNERCEKPLTCKFGRHPQKLTCSTCTTVWAIAHRKAVLA